MRLATRFVSEDQKAGGRGGFCDPTVRCQHKLLLAFPTVSYIYDASNGQSPSICSLQVKIAESSTCVRDRVERRRGAPPSLLSSRHHLSSFLLGLIDSINDKQYLSFPPYSTSLPDFINCLCRCLQVTFRLVLSAKLRYRHHLHVNL